VQLAGHILSSVAMLFCDMCNIIGFSGAAIHSKGMDQYLRQCFMSSYKRVTRFRQCGLRELE
jgi:hypothetical protein